MSESIEIHNVPDDLYREATSRAAAEGVTLSAFVLRHLERALSYSTVGALLDRVEARERPKLPETPGQMVRGDRDSR